MNAFQTGRKDHLVIYRDFLSIAVLWVDTPSLADIPGVGGKPQPQSTGRAGVTARKVKSILMRS
jgi:hypothetical protein